MAQPNPEPGEQMISPREVTADYRLDSCQRMFTGSAPQGECLGQRKGRPATIAAMDREKACVLLRKSQSPYHNALTTSYDAVHFGQLAVDLNVRTGSWCHL